MKYIARVEGPHRDDKLFLAGHAVRLLTCTHAILVDSCEEEIVRCVDVHSFVTQLAIKFGLVKPLLVDRVSVSVMMLMTCVAAVVATCKS